MKVTTRLATKTDAAQPTSQVNADRRWAEEMGRFAVELEVLMALARCPNPP